MDEKTPIGPKVIDICLMAHSMGTSRSGFREKMIDREISRRFADC
jgi:hypothetical protein